MFDRSQTWRNFKRKTCHRSENDYSDQFPEHLIAVKVVYNHRKWILVVFNEFQENSAKVATNDIIL